MSRWNVGVGIQMLAWGVKCVPLVLLDVFREKGHQSNRQLGPILMKNEK